MNMIPPPADRADQVLDEVFNGLSRFGAAALSRRRLLQVAGGVAAGTIASSRIPFVRDAVGLGTADANEVTPTVVLVYMDGGNDGLNTVVPTTNSQYYQLRQSLAIPAPNTLAITPSYGLHPSLPFVQSWYQQGRVAIVRGIGYANSNLSHFVSVDHWHAGSGAADSPVVASPHSGWVGRYGDAFASNPFSTIAIGPQTPISMRGASRSALQIPIPSATLFGTSPGDLNEAWVATAMRSINTSGTGTGSLGTAVASRTVSALDVAPSVAGSWNSVDGDSITRQMLMAANLINAQLGARVISVAFDGFDTHAQQLGTHASLLSQLNGALSAFFARLAPNLQRNVIVMTYSEFGRRAVANQSAGTDHGASSIGMVFGANVRGGLYGDDPGLQSLDGNGNTLVTTDFRRLYATVLSGWLGADATQVLGATHDPLPLFAAGPGVQPTTTTSTSSTTTSTTTTSTTTTTTPRAGAPQAGPVSTVGRQAAPQAATTTTIPPGQASVWQNEPGALSPVSSAAGTVAANTGPVPSTTVPQSAPVTTVPQSAPVTTVPVTTVSSTSVPASTGPASVVPITTIPSGSGNGSTNSVASSSGVVAGTVPTAASQQPIMQVTLRKRLVTVKVTNGPARNDTFVTVRNAAGELVTKRYLNNRTRPNVVNRSSGTISVELPTAGTFTVQLYAYGSTVPVATSTLIVA
jgi:uncharacterized protein (DUF1501 family)